MGIGWFLKQKVVTALASFTNRVSQSSVAGLAPIYASFCMPLCYIIAAANRTMRELHACWLSVQEGQQHLGLTAQLFESNFAVDARAQCRAKPISI